ncbi:helix-turn-helix domain-containing protein, partial [Niveispirillum sp.]|uniref:helix-turn-helix domain-containing protein n=1 Tax=Niveispirillum sp. TaxID=1917217 RepID=UPI001B556129
RGRRARAGIDAQAVLDRHGSRDAVLAPCSREKLLRAAVARWSVARTAPHERWTDSLSGWTTASPPRHMPPEIRRAVETAYSLPISVAGAMAELDYWEKRGAEIAAMRGLDGQVVAEDADPTLHLDLPAYARAIVIRRLVEHSLRAATIQDALARAEYWRAHSGRGSWVEAAILADLRHLAGMERAARGQDGTDADTGQPTHFRTASERREEVIRMLADADLAALPDREIARRVGVSPQTVGNLRRRVGDGGHRGDG